MMPRIQITTIAPPYFAGLATLQQTCYPTLGADELMTVAHFESQYHIFAEGQIVVLASNEAGHELVVRQGSGFFIDFDFAHPHH
ncbi:MAG: GNAT family N-acetyltransferase, partial [Caldilineaceae bacterium]|nr:GNAT family N-acetyltransferase [Caldilineaceae bacterium]